MCVITCVDPVCGYVIVSSGCKLVLYMFEYPLMSVQTVILGQSPVNPLISIYRSQNCVWNSLFVCQLKAMDVYVGRIYLIFIVIVLVVHVVGV
jgi:hypothetical protein